MSYGDKYKFEYKDQPLGRRTTVIISEDGYTGEVEWIKGGGDPVQIESKSDNNYILNQIYGSECTLNIISETSMKFVDLFNSNAFKYKVTIWKEPEPDESQIVWWIGYLLPDEYSEPLDFYINYEVSLRARDVLGGLKTTDFLNDNGQKYVGKAKVIKIIADCLKKTGLNLFINFSVNLEEVNFPGTIDPLDNIYLDYEAFYLEKTPTCEYVLKQILQSFGARIIMNTGSWWIQRVALFRSQHTVYAYDANGNYIYNFLYNPSKTYSGKYDETNNRLYFADKKGQLDINPAFKEFKIIQNLGKKTSATNNGSFEFFNGKNIPGWSVTKTENHDYEIIERVTLGEVHSDSNNYCFKSFSKPNQTQGQAEWLILKSDAVKITLDENKGLKLSFDGRAVYTQGKIKVKIGNKCLAIKDVAYPNNLELYGPEVECVLVDEEIEYDNVNYDYMLRWGSASATEMKTYTLNFLPTEPIDDYITISFYMPHKNINYFPAINQLTYLDNISVDFTDRSGQTNYPREVSYYVNVDQNNNEVPSEIESIVGDLPELTDKEDIYIGGYWGFNRIDFIPTYSWLVLGTDRQLSLMEILADSILDQHLKPKQQISAELRGNFDFNHTIIIPFMGNKMYLPIRISLSDKYCKFDVEMIELLETDGEGGKVLATNLLEPIATNNDQLIKIT